MGSSGTLPPGRVSDGRPTGVNAVALALHRRTVRRVGSAIGYAIGAGTTVVCLTGCSWFSGSDADAPKPVEISVLDVQPGQCFTAQQEVQAEIATLGSIPCDTPHQQESYAIVDYQPPTGVTGDAFPGDADLKSYADANCAQQFEQYVGISYLDSSLFFTYLVPSARGWEQNDDRSIVCFITTTGAELTSSAKASKQ